MSQKTVRIFLAIALGAYVGTAVANETLHNFWWTAAGLVIGSFIAYVVCDFKEVLAVAPIAWQKATSWRPDWEWWRTYLGALGSITSWMLWLWIVMSAFVGYEEYIHSEFTLIPFLVIGLACLAFVFIYSFTLFAAPIQMNEMVANLPGPLTFTFVIAPRSIFKAEWFTVTHIPAGVKALRDGGAVAGKFFWFLVRLIHSELRLLCAVDAAIGVTIGCFYHSAIVGGLAGGLIGVLNFEILSIWVLELVPATESIFHRR